MRVEENLRKLLDKCAEELGRQDAEITELRRKLRRAEEAVVELRAIAERAHTEDA